MVDTHAHLGLCEPPPAELVAAAREAGVRRILEIGIDEGSSRDALGLAEAHPEVLACVGRHPNSAAGFDDEAAAALERLAAHPRVRAVGETGLDYFREGAPRGEQRRAFASQLELARGAGLPAVIHMRDGTGDGDDAIADCFELLAERAEGVTVILHCFSGGPERAREAAERGWRCSFAGNLTFPKARELQEAAPLVPDELLLCETDSPFLAPQPLRGKPNQPANVVATAKRLAELRGQSYTELEATVEANAARVFGW